jgi:hypothetical protein
MDSCGEPLISRCLCRFNASTLQRFDNTCVRGRRRVDCIGRMARRPSDWEIASQCNDFDELHSAFNFYLKRDQSRPVRCI